MVRATYYPTRWFRSSDNSQLRRITFRRGQPNNGECRAFRIVMHGIKFQHVLI